MGLDREFWRICEKRLKKDHSESLIIFFKFNKTEELILIFWNLLKSHFCFKKKNIYKNLKYNAIIILINHYTPLYDRNIIDELIINYIMIYYIFFHYFTLTKQILWNNLFFPFFQSFLFFPFIIFFFFSLFFKIFFTFKS